LSLRLAQKLYHLRLFCKKEGKVMMEQNIAGIPSRMKSYQHVSIWNHRREDSFTQRRS
jgi:hypothetical protein